MHLTLDVHLQAPFRDARLTPVSVEWIFGDVVKSFNQWILKAT